MSVRPLFRKIVIAVFVVLIPIFTHYVWEYIELRRLIAEIEAIRAKGEPVTEYQAGRGRSPEGEEQLPGRLYIASAVLAGGTEDNWTRDIAAMREWLVGAGPTPPAGMAGVKAVLAQTA